MPDWAANRSLRDVLSISGQMEGVLRNFNQQGTIPRAAAAPEPQPTPPQAFGDDDYVSGRQVRDFATTWAQQTLAPQIEQTQRLAASGNYQMTRDRFKDVFTKYGPEVDAHLATIPPAQWTLQTLEKVVKFVQSDHLEELLESRTRERVQQQLQDMGSSGLRSNGAPGGGSAPPHNTQAQHTLRDPAVRADWREAAEKAGLTEGQIDSFCRATNTSREDFFKGLTSGAIAAAGGGR